jgi:hypothetical protein
VLDWTVHGGVLSPRGSLSGSVEQPDEQGKASWFGPFLNQNSCHFPLILLLTLPA